MSLIFLCLVSSECFVIFVVLIVCFIFPCESFFDYTLSVVRVCHCFVRLFLLLVFVIFAAVFGMWTCGI